MAIRDGLLRAVADNHRKPEEVAAEHVRGWAEGEETSVRERGEMLSELVPAMEARGYDTGAVKAVVGG